MSLERDHSATPAEPSWARVLANTVELAVVRWLRAAGRRRWVFAACGVALAGVAVVTLWLIGGQPASTSPAAPAAQSGTGPGPSLPDRVRSAAATWIAGQVSDGATIACDPGMCAVLQERGVAAGRLMPLRSANVSPFGASVLVASWSADQELAGQSAPALIASFGSGADRIGVFAVGPGGTPAYRAAFAADLAARRSAGSQLLRNPRIRFSRADAAPLLAGYVDTRLLATLAVLASQYSFQVATFGDTAPGAAVLYREVTITGVSSGRPAALAMVRAQNPPYVPARVAATGRTGLSIEFAVPSPLGLLSPVIGDGSPSAPAAGTNHN